MKTSIYKMDKQGPTWNYIQYPVINHIGKEYGKECVYVNIYMYVCMYIYIYIYIYMSHFAIQ